MVMKKYYEYIHNLDIDDQNYINDLYELYLNALINTAWLRHDNDYDTKVDYLNDYKFGTLFEQQLKSELTYYYNNTTQTNKYKVTYNTEYVSENDNENDNEYFVCDLNNCSDTILKILSEGLNEVELEMLDLINLGMSKGYIIKKYSRNKFKKFYDKALFNLKCYQEENI